MAVNNGSSWERRVSHKSFPNRPSSNSKDSPTTLKKKFEESASQWDLENDYDARVSRKRRKLEKQGPRLPTLTQQGKLGNSVLPDLEDESSDGDESAGEAATGDGRVSPVDIFLESGQPQLSERQRIILAKEKLAKAASLITEDPEEHPSLFKELAQIGASNHPTVKQLAIMTQLTVYKDLIPSYRIKPVAEVEVGVKLSKEVKRLRDYEQSLVKGYHNYIKELAQLSRRGKQIASIDKSANLDRIAIFCACDLLKSVPHFNFRQELLAIIVGKLKTRGKINESYTECLEALEHLFHEDEEGSASLEAVKLLTKMIAARDFKVDESVVNTLLHLSLLSQMSSGDTGKSDSTKPGTRFKGKKVKQEKVHLSKKQRKYLKERKGIEKEMEAAEAVVGEEERQTSQSEILKLVFATYLKILKAKITSLTGAVLEGLARYAHLINQDFFGDVLEVLRELVEQIEAENGGEEQDDVEDINEISSEQVSQNVSRQSLLCIVTAFALLEGQQGAKTSSSLQLDLDFFVGRLYRAIYSLSLEPDIEFNSKTLRLPEPGDAIPPPNTKVNVKTTATLLMRCLSHILLPAHNYRSVPPIRLAAFTKQLFTSSLQLPEKSCVGTLGLLGHVAIAHSKRVSGLWDTEERRGDGVFDPISSTAEASNPFAATIWEGELLRLHFSPKVRDSIKGVENTVRSSK